MRNLELRSSEANNSPLCVCQKRLLANRSKPDTLTRIIVPQRSTFKIFWGLKLKILTCESKVIEIYLEHLHVIKELEAMPFISEELPHRRVHSMSYSDRSANDTVRVRYQPKHAHQGLDNYFQSIVY